MSSPIIDCTSCGACCFGGHDRYIAILPQDQGRAIPDHVTTQIDGRRYMTMSCGHCAQLTATQDGRLICGIYDDRPEACRAFRAGSFECNKARQHRGPDAAALRAFAMPQTQAAQPVIAAPNDVALVGGDAAPPEIGVIPLP